MKYLVIVDRLIKQRARVSVEARNPSEASVVACREAREEPQDWAAIGVVSDPCRAGTAEDVTAVNA
jgi:hypothetical protein